ncbi:MAG: hypothetical protein H0T79_05545 [Deltaproteobacteria bacterium]|nr:hypothetical protein [Deltaproteobacteria bacterium]
MRQLLAVVFGIAAASLALPSARADLRRAAPIIEPTERLPPVELSGTSRVLWLDRCASGCTIHLGPSDAANDTSMIPKMETSTLAPFAFTEAEWTQIVTCVSQVYSPFDIEVTERRPAAGV